MGTPVVIVPERYVLARSVVAGRFVNAFCTSDWTLSLNFRARSVSISPLFRCLSQTNHHLCARALCAGALCSGGALPERLLHERLDPEPELQSSLGEQCCTRPLLEADKL